MATKSLIHRFTNSLHRYVLALFGLVLCFLLINLSTYQPINCLYAQEIDVKTKIKELNHSKASIRAQAVIELTKAGKNKKSVEALVDRLKIEKDVNVRNAIYEALGNIGDKEAVPVLTEKVKTENNKNIKPMAVLALGKLQDESSVAVLREIFLNGDESIEVRLQAANALTYIPTEASVKVLEEGLKSENPTIRLQAVCSLATFSSDILIKERRELIRKQAENDPDEKNRAFIKEKILAKPKE